MSVPLFTTIGENLLQLFGSPYIMAMVFIGIIVFMILAAKIDSMAGKVLLVMLTLPMLIVLVGTGASKYIALSQNYTWIPIIGWVIAGAIMAGVFWGIMR